MSLQTAIILWIISFFISFILSIVDQKMIEGVVIVRDTITIFLISLIPIIPIVCLISYTIYTRLQLTDKFDKILNKRLF